MCQTRQPGRSRQCRPAALLGIEDTNDAHATGQRALLTMLGLFVAG